MKHVKLFESFLSDKKKEEEDPGTELSNTTGAEVSEDVYNYKDIDKWDDKTVEKIYGYFLDELTNDKREAEEKKNLTVARKREALKNKEKKFTHSFKK